MPPIVLETLQSLKDFVGREIATTDWFLVTQDRIRQFCLYFVVLVFAVSIPAVSPGVLLAGSVSRAGQLLSREHKLLCP